MPTGRTLYEIDEELAAIIAAGEEVGMDTQQIDALIDCWLEGSEGEVEEKIDAYCQVISERTRLAKMRREEAQAIVALAQFDENVADKLKERAKNFFERLGITKMETAYFKPRIQANGGVQPMKLADEVIQDPSLLPEGYTKLVPDMEAIRDALELGREFGQYMGKERGTIQLATLEPRGKHFRIR